jgi:hypothetical protein
MPEEFRSFSDVRILLGKINGKTLKSAYKRYTGENIESGMGGAMAIGDIARASKSVRILHGRDTVRDVVERRIAASAGGQTIKMGIVPM